MTMPQVRVLVLPQIRDCFGSSAQGFHIDLGALVRGWVTRHQPQSSFSATASEVAELGLSPQDDGALLFLVWAKHVRIHQVDRWTVRECSHFVHQSGSPVESQARSLQLDQVARDHLVPIVLALSQCIDVFFTHGGLLSPSAKSVFAHARGKLRRIGLLLPLHGGFPLRTLLHTLLHTLLPLRTLLNADGRDHDGQHDAQGRFGAAAWLRWDERVGGGQKQCDE
mmetsp:Transcript_27727/g.66018  ORF Transcript_27727/g.66018 Transcript_27727/m.66018 type:complete len:224 (-) Transcript_27727:86-757(-)